MAQFLGFGDGSDGDVTLSGAETPIDSSCSGTAGTNTLTVGASLSFAAGQIVLIHQTRGTGVGNWELAKVSAYSGTTLTLETNIVNTYTDSGASQAQVRVLRQYRSVIISSTFTPKSWDGDVGGIAGFLCSGKVTISSTVLGGYDGSNPSSGSGFRQATVEGGQGEGTAGDRNSVSTAANGNGAGGGSGGVNENRPGGGGGGYSAAGSNGGAGAGTGGSGGNSVGSADLTTAMFGGAGGASTGTVNASGGVGGNGAGLFFIFFRELVITGSISYKGSTGQVGGSTVGPGGGGAGGGVFLKGITADIGTNLIDVRGGSGGTGGGGPGGAGADGRIRIEVCKLTGSTTFGSVSTSEGGHPFCATGGFIY